MIRESSTVPSHPTSDQPPPSLSPRAPHRGEQRDFEQTLRQLGRAVDAAPRVRPAHGAERGPGGYSTLELLALQMQVYRYTEAVDLVAKLVDRTTTAVRTTLQNSG